MASNSKFDFDNLSLKPAKNKTGNLERIKTHQDNYVSSCWSYYHITWNHILIHSLLALK